MKGSAIITASLPWLVIVLILAVIEAIYRTGHLPIFLPSPSMLWSSFIESPTLWPANMGPTLWKAATGFGIAAGLSLAGAGLGAVVLAAYAPIYNLGATLQSIPIIATTPLLALWLGTGAETQITIAVLVSQFPMLNGAMQGFRAADARQREMMHCLAASPLQTLRYLILPAALPFIFAGFKIAAPAAVLGVITAEWAGAERGVGAVMLNALFAYDTPKVWLSVIAACVLAGGGYGVWALVERLVVVWDRPTELRQ